MHRWQDDGRTHRQADDGEVAVRPRTGAEPRAIDIFIAPRTQDANGAWTCGEFTDNLTLGLFVLEAEDFDPVGSHADAVTSLNPDATGPDVAGTDEALVDVAAPDMTNVDGASPDGATAGAAKARVRRRGFAGRFRSGKRCCSSRRSTRPMCSRAW
jgi:hypothetical protein